MRSSLVTLAAAAVLCAGCAGDEGATGSGGDWIEGRALTVRVTSTDMGGTMEVRNDSDGDASFAPLKIVVDDQVVADLDAASAQQSVLRAGENFTFPISSGDAMETVRIEMGTGEDREVFTVTM